MHSIARGDIERMGRVQCAVGASVARPRAASPEAVPGRVPLWPPSARITCGGVSGIRRRGDACGGRRRPAGWLLRGKRGADGWSAATGR